MDQDQAFSDYIVYVDESGHSASAPDPNYPCFVLAFCLFEKTYYRTRLAPALQQLKFRFFGHDMVIMHERDIRKATGCFALLRKRSIRDEFFSALNQLVEEAELSIISHVIHKNGDHLPEDNLYHMAAQHCLEALYDKLSTLHQAEVRTHIVFEERGKTRPASLNSSSAESAPARTSTITPTRLCRSSPRKSRILPDCSLPTSWPDRLEITPFTRNKPTGHMKSWPVKASNQD